MGANQNARKLLSTDLVNTKYLFIIVKMGKKMGSIFAAS